MTAPTDLPTEDHAPRVRCYRCGSDKIASLCHHCGKAMCEDHRSQVMTVANTPVSTEFDDLGLELEHSGAYHCDKHEHVVKGSLKNLIRAGIGVVVAGVLLILLNLVVGLVIAIIGAGITAAAYYFDGRRRQAALDARPPVPLLPSLDSVNVRETLSGQIRLSDGGKYTSPRDKIKIEGAVDVVMTLTDSDRKRPQKYRDKYQKNGLARSEPVKFSAGFGVIEGEAGIKLAPGSGQGVTLLPGGMGVAFEGDVAGHPLFTRSDSRPAPDGEESRPPGEWAVHVPYSLHGVRPPESMPIWLVPSLVPDSDRRTLELDIHWVTLQDDQRPRGERHPLTPDMLELIELVVPTEWGNVESTDPDATVWNPEPNRTRKIQWKRLRVARQDRSKILTIRFAKPVKLDSKSAAGLRTEQSDENESRFHLRGKIQASFRGTVSGVEGFAIYRALGYPWKRPKAAGKTEPDAKTEVSVDFDLSLNSIRYQKVLVIPGSDQEELAGKAVDRSGITEFAGVVPDYRTVIELTNRMSSNYYVKRVIENPPSVGSRANVLNRFWDIAGRYYDGVYPVDFHVTLTGEEDYADSLRAHTGSTAVRLTVQGMYVDDDADAPKEGALATAAEPTGKVTMRAQIERQWNNLYDLIKDTLDARAHAVGTPVADQRYPETPSATVSGGNGQPASHGLEPHYPSHPATAPADREPTGQWEDRAAMLRKRRDAATEALLAGRISEDMYREIVAGIDAEIAGT